MIDRPDENSDARSLRPAVPVADAQDVRSLYNLVLRRDPEIGQVIQDRLGRPIYEIFAELLDSPEFQRDVLPTIATDVSGAAVYKGTQDFGELLAWAESRLPLSRELRKRLFHAESWAACDEILFTSPELLDQFPAIRHAGVDQVLEFRKLNRKIERSRDIRGGIDYANVWELKGWCANARNQQERLTVEIIADNELLGVATCREYRRDIHEKFGGDGHFGFTFSIPAAMHQFLQKERQVTIRERSTGVAIGESVFIHGDLPRRADLIDSIREEFVHAKDTIAKLEAELRHLTANFGYPIQAYDEFARYFDQVTQEQMADYHRRLDKSDIDPTIWIVLMFDSQSLKFLDRSVRSIQGQIYPKWELVVVGAASPETDEATVQLAILHKLVGSVRLRLLPEPADVAALMREGVAQCSGDYVIFLRAGDCMMSDALYHNVGALQRPGIKAVYADEDCYDFQDGKFRRHSPRLKPDFDPDYLQSDNYIGRFVLFDRAVLSKVGDPKTDIPGAEEFDLLLRFVEIAGSAGIVHVPLVLYHRYHAEGLPTLGDSAAVFPVCRVVNDHLRRTGLAATAEPHTDLLGSARPFALRLRWSLPDPAPKVSLIIATKDHPELLGPCMASLLTTTKNYRGPIEILAVDNGTTDPIARTLLKSLADNGSARTISYPGSFNWSAMNNHAARQAEGDVLVFLNNDILAIADGWLDELVGQAIRPEIGAVGGRLLYADGTIQHAGIVLGVNGSSCHEAIGEPVANGGYLGRSHLQRRTSAVTGACLTTRRDVFMRVNGFDELAFRITFSDIDYCLKVAAGGLGVAYTPFATLHHFESGSRGIDKTNLVNNGIDDELTAFRAKWREALQSDPNYNPNFSRVGRPFTYLNASKRY